ncbi:MAG: hypothetical protein AAB628_01470 [Patescibacteria group bacterium]
MDNPREFINPKYLLNTTLGGFIIEITKEAHISDLKDFKSIHVAGHEVMVPSGTIKQSKSRTFQFQVNGQVFVWQFYVIVAIHKVNRSGEKTGYLWVNKDQLHARRYSP